MKTRNLTIFTLAVAVLCIAARTATLLYATQSGTGFFITRLAPLAISLSVGIFLLTVIAGVFSFTAEEKAVTPFTPSAYSGVCAIVLGGAVLLYSLGVGAHGYLIAWQHILEVASGILCGIWFVVFGMTAFVELKLPKITAIIPCIHSITRLIVVFTSLSTSALVAEHVFSLAYHVMVMVYMLNFGRLVAGEPEKNSKSVFFPITVVAFIFTCTSVFSRFITLLADKTEMIHGETALDVSGMILSIFMLLSAVDICKEIKEQPKEEAENEV